MNRALRAWLDGRRPLPPEDLRARIDGAVDKGRDGSADIRPPDAGATSAGSGTEVTDGMVDDLLQAGLSSLSRARSRPGRVRETAFELLVADALLTYACEAALESEAPEEALSSILDSGTSA